MAMRETFGTLRAYFALSAVLGGLASFSQVIHSGGKAMAAGVGIINLGFALAFIYVGLSLRRLLTVSARAVTTLLFVSTAWAALLILLSVLGGAHAVEIIVLALSILILGYLLVDVRRLSAAPQQASGKPSIPRPH